MGRGLRTMPGESQEAYVKRVDERNARRAAAREDKRAARRKRDQEAADKYREDLKSGAVAPQTGKGPMSPRTARQLRLNASLAAVHARRAAVSSQAGGGCGSNVAVSPTSSEGEGSCFPAEKWMRERAARRLRGETLSPLVVHGPAPVPTRPAGEYKRVMDALRGSGGAGASARSALARLSPKGVGEGCAWVPGQRAPVAMSLPKKAVRGGRIPPRMRVEDTALGSAALNAADEERHGAAPLSVDDESSARRVNAVRAWSAHATWSLCVWRVLLQLSLLRLQRCRMRTKRWPGASCFRRIDSLAMYSAVSL